MTRKVWRITKRKHEKTAFTGAGAKKYGGRWNNPGTAIVYTSETQSLGALEMLVHLETPELLLTYVLIGVEMDESLVIDLDSADLPENWKADPPSAKLKAIGDEWAARKGSVVLRVPSVLVPGEHNFLLNPAHEGFGELLIGKAIEFFFDRRLTPRHKQTL